jgi:hypothetical protein
VQVHVENGRRSNLARGDHRVDRDHEPVERAESLAVVRVRVVEAARDRGRDAVAAGAPRSGEAAAVGQQDGAVELGRPGELLRLGEVARLAGRDGGDVLAGVHSQQGPSSVTGRGSLEPNPGLAAERVGDPRELRDRHDVLADRRCVSGW